MSNQKNQKANEKTDLPETFTQDSDSAVQVQVSALLEELHQINREDNPEAYADAQVNLGNLYDFQGNQEKAKKHIKRPLRRTKKFSKAIDKPTRGRSTSLAPSMIHWGNRTRLKTCGERFAATIIQKHTHGRS